MIKKRLKHLEEYYIGIVSVALMPFPVAHGRPARLSPPPLSSKLPGSTAAPGPERLLIIPTNIKKYPESEQSNCPGEGRGVLPSKGTHLDLRLLLLLAGGLALLLTPTLGLLDISSPSELSAVYDFREVCFIWLSSNA